MSVEDLWHQIAIRFRLPKGTRVVQRVPEVCEICKGRKVLHLGCSDAPYTEQRGGDLLHRQLAAVTGDLWGLDFSEDGIEALKRMGFDRVYCGDVEDCPKELAAERFDVILAGEIIEHLANPGRFLESITALMQLDTMLVLTTPNATAIKGFVHALLQTEKVHPDHNYYFSHRTIQQLCQKFGLACDEVYYYQEYQGAFDRLMGPFARMRPALSDGVSARTRRLGLGVRDGGN